MVFSAGPRRGLLFWAIKGWCMWMHVACYSVTLTQLAQLKKCHKRLPIRTLLYFLWFFLLKVFAQVYNRSKYFDRLHFTFNFEFPQAESNQPVLYEDTRVSLIRITHLEWHQLALTCWDAKDWRDWNTPTFEYFCRFLSCHHVSNSVLFCYPYPWLTSKWEFSWCINSHPMSEGNGVSWCIYFVTFSYKLRVQWHWVHKLERKLQLPYTWNSSLQKKTLPGVRTEKLEPGRNSVRRVGFLWFLQRKHQLR